MQSAPTALETASFQDLLLQLLFPLLRIRRRGIKYFSDDRSGCHRIDPDPVLGEGHGAAFVSEITPALVAS